MRIWGTEDEHVFRIRKRKGRGGPGGGAGTESERLDE